MAVYTSDVNRITGLASGIDTDSMVDQMMKAESAKYERLQKEEQTLTWKQEAYREIITALQKFEDKWFSTNLSNNIGYSTFWNNFSTSVVDSTTGLDSNAIKINSTTSTGSYEIKVEQVAQTEAITGGAVATNITTGSSIKDIEGGINEYESISLKISLDGQSKEIEITKEDLVDSTGASRELVDVFNEKLQNAFGTTSGKAKVYTEVSTNSSGEEVLVFKTEGNGHTLAIAEGTERKEGTSTTQSGVLGSDVTEYSITIDGYTATAKFNASLSADEKLEKIQEALKNAEDGNGNTKDISSLVTLDKSGTDDLTITNKSSGENIYIDTSFKKNDVTETTSTKELKPTGSLGLLSLNNTTDAITTSTKLSSAISDLFPSGTDELTLNFGGKDITINKSDTVQTLINKVNASDGNVTLSFNEVTNRFTVTSSESGENGNIEITDNGTIDFLSKLGIDVVDKTNSNNANYVQGQDAIFSVDGVQTSRPSNDISMNGINFTINGVGTVKVEANTDEDAMFNKIKEFVDDYNSLIDKINEKVKETRPKSNGSYYEPLTSDEKAALSDDEVEKWEAQAKAGLLYNDEYLNKLLSSFRSMVYESVDIGGKTISLYEIGITTTSNYNDGGKLEIDETKLKAAISERGDEIIQLFTTSGTGIADTLKSNINNAIGSTGYLRNKAGIVGTTSVNNNSLSDELKAIAEKLSAEKDRLYKKELNYYEIFSAMETAITQQNNQLSVLLSYTS